MNKKTTRGARGDGSIRKIEIERAGKKYTYWQARYTIGRSSGTGKQVQKSITGKTQKEVRQKLKELTAAVDTGTYSEPSKMTVAEWLDIWTTEYLNSVKPRTVDSYKSSIEHHIKPAIGALRLSSLSPADIQHLYNNLKNAKTGESLSAKTIKNCHGALHKALEQAVKLGYIRTNPADKPDLPKVERAEIKPLNDAEIATFLQNIKGHKFERVFLTTLFTGLREGEVLGLTWDCIDFKTGKVVVKQQLQLLRGTGGKYTLALPKNGKTRVLMPARFVMEELQKQRKDQLSERLRLGAAYQNPLNLVFTNEIGGNLCPQTVYLHFKKIAAAAGFPDARFHDLRHSYAVAALRSGDDIKTVQVNLGHHSAAFTLDTYAHATEQMMRESSDRMERFISTVKVV